ncbi:MAG: MBL fold metallo-hydrolase [Planctomycetia bacterium]|nr:MBL fold metallo-hydrolase [Planctomycetia bacterium]
MKRRDFCKILAAASAFPFQESWVMAQNAPEVGTVYPGWREGEMDIHFIFTGIGENCFLIFPDGTSMMMDAGDMPSSPVPRLPDTSRRAGEWIARYVERVNPAGKHVDYMMLSHYHSDHAGRFMPDAKMTTGRGEDYCLSGLAQVGEFLHFDTGFDRCWPHYESPIPAWPSESPTFENFSKFVQWKQKNDGLKMEELQVGKLDQIRLRKNPEKYPNFHTRTICRNGTCWTGKGEEAIHFLEETPGRKGKSVPENSLSIASVFSYGPFRFYTGGDVSDGLYDEEGNRFAYEGMVGKVAGPVDVCKANHHAYKDAMKEEFVREIQARVYVICVWDIHHIQDNTMTNMASRTLYPGDRVICPTLIPDGRKELYQGKSWWENVEICGGHVVVKVLNGGTDYKVYYLTANDESMTIKAVLGPWKSRGT